MEFIKTDERHTQYLRDESRMEGRAEWIVFPKNARELAAALKTAAEQGLRVTLQGSLTGIAGGAVPRGGLIVNLSQMRQVLRLRYDGEALLVTLEAGVTLSQLDLFLRSPPPEAWDDDVSAEQKKTLLRQPFFFAPGPTEKEASFGGLFACNAGGLHSLAFGRTGAQTEALCWLTPGGGMFRLHRGDAVFDRAGCNLPDGKRIRCKTILKNSPVQRMIPHEGMDLIDFLAGSEGLLGAAAELTVRMLPEPPFCWGVLYFFCEKETEAAFLQRLFEWHQEHADGMTASEYYDGSVLRLIEENKATFSAVKGLPAFPDNAGSALYVELAGEDEEALNERLFAHLELFLSSGGAEEHTWAACGAQEMEKFRVLRHSVPELVNVEIDKKRQHFSALTKTAGDFSAPPALFSKYLNLYKQGIAKTELPAYLFGHVFENHFHINFVPENSGQMAACKDLLTEWAAQTVYDGGCIAAENGVGELKKDWTDGFLSQEQKEHIQAVITAFKEL
ncbi:MAG: FAD-binding oxidoreductase [Oscillospiraceae bacterium]|nr:FAD-binding oxidoreductase [Oscillospiraceae bacterium]